MHLPNNATRARNPERPSGTRSQRFALGAQEDSSTIVSRSRSKRFVHRPSQTCPFRKEVDDSDSWSEQRSNDPSTSRTVIKRLLNTNSIRISLLRFSATIKSCTAVKKHLQERNKFQKSSIVDWLNLLWWKWQSAIVGFKNCQNSKQTIDTIQSPESQLRSLRITLEKHRPASKI